MVESVPPSAAGLDVVFFGTYDEGTHPRVRGLREGLEANGARIRVCNRPLGVDTEARVELVRRPHRLVGFVVRLLVCWVGLVVDRLRLRGSPAVVVVGYLGHFDVHLARMLFRRSTLVLDHLIGLSDTAKDRALDGRGPVDRVLDAVDRAALRAADLVVFDTDEHADHLGGAVPVDERVVVPVGAPAPYFAARPDSLEPDGEALRVIFYGLYTPLQGAVTIGEAIALLADDPAITFTMIGSGQDRAAAERAAAGGNATWIDWLPVEELPARIAEHDVCLGIFGTSDKARRVVPNKVFQGAAAGAAIVTSDTPCQRAMLGDAAVHVVPGDPVALAEALRALASDRRRLADVRAAGARLADERFAPTTTVAPLLRRLSGAERGH